jgi:hypothetical protein
LTYGGAGLAWTKFLERYSSLIMRVARECPADGVVAEN